MCYHQQVVGSCRFTIQASIFCLVSSMAPEIRDDAGLQVVFDGSGAGLEPASQHPGHGLRPISQMQHLVTINILTLTQTTVVLTLRKLFLRPEDG